MSNLNLDRAFTYFGATVFLVASVLFGLNAQPAEMAISGGLMVALLFFVHLDRISAFPWWGGKAKSRKIVAEALSAVEQLKVLAKTLAYANLAGVVAGGRFSSEPDIPEAVRKTVIKSLRDLKLSDKEIRQAQGVYSAYVSYDHRQNILKAAHGSGGVPSDSKADWDEAFEWSLKPPTADEMSALLQRFNKNNPETGELIEDYRFWLENLEYRRPKTWKRD